MGRGVYLKDLTFYIQDGLIGQHNPTTYAWDFGDCSQRMGDYHFWKKLENPLVSIREEFINIDKTISLLEVSPGTWRRHPNQYSEPSDYSRDQQLSLQCALAVHDKIDVLKRMIFKQWGNFGRYQNGDIRTWEFALDCRSLRYWFCYPLIAVFDLGLVVNVVLRLIIGGLNSDNVGDDINLTVVTIFCNYRYPTPFSWLARKLYSMRNIERAWSWYFRQPESPPLDELMAPLISRWLK